jgi:hypothetical protein
MKWSILYFALLTLAGCNNKPLTSSQSTTNSSLPDSVEKACFQRLEGLQNQDTTNITLLISGNKVTGTFNYLPYQKDSRKGSVTGEKQGDIIKGLWTYVQEGLKDTLVVEFKLQKSLLLQKSFGIDEATGRPILTDTSTFSIPYNAVKCSSDLQ